MNEPVFIVKANGEREPFDRTKLEQSLRRIGTEESLIQTIVNEVAVSLLPEVTTHDIYRRAYALLRKKQHSVAFRYSLRKALAELGPSGFPFEKYIARMFESKGYNALTGQIVMGDCVPHEMDVVAWKDDQLIMTEAKFHTDFNAKSDLKVALYIKARFDDLYGKKFQFGGKERDLSEGWLITNTKFTTTAIQYGECKKLKMIGWNYPKNHNLHNMLEEANLIPITAMSSISATEKKIFLANGVVLARELADLTLLNRYGFGANKIATIKAEADLFNRTGHLKS